MYRINLLTRKIYPVLLVLLAVAACNQQKAVLDYQRPISEPFENLTIGCNGNTVDAEKGGEIFFATGTKLYIPPNAFVDEDGEPVKGDVTIGFREFHSPAEVMVSGIPMKYNNNGEVEDFETAGMFEITAEAGGTSVDLAEGKSVDVWLSSKQEEDNYNFYRFDQETQQWVEVSTGSQNVQVNKEKEEYAILQENAKEMQSQQPAAPQPYDQSKPVYEFGFSPYTQSGQIQENALKLWQTVGEATLNEKTVLATSQSWDSYELRSLDPQEGTYELLVSQGDERYRIEVKQVLFGPELRRAKGQYARSMDMYKQGYDELMAELNEKAETQERQNQFNRLVSVSSMGVYNCDRYRMAQETLNVQVDYELEGGGVLGDNVTMYVIAGEGKNRAIVYQYGSALKLDMSEKNALITVLSGDRVAYLSANELSAYNLASMNREGYGTLKLNVFEHKMDNVEDLEHFMASL